MTDDERLYLQFLQNNIARMNTNSAQAKGWCIAIVAALLAIFAQTNNALFIWICFIPIVLFCILDTLYLQQEHKFVGMYNDFIKDKENKPNVYEMPMTSYAKGVKGFLKALCSWSVGLVYGILLLTVAIVGMISETKHIRKEELTGQKIVDLADIKNFSFFEKINLPIFIIILVATFLISIIIACVLAKRSDSSKDNKSKIELGCTVFSTIISPVLTIVSVLLVVLTLQLQSKNSKQDSYNTEFSILFAEMKDFIEGLSVEVKYNIYSEEPVTLTKLEVIDELAYYLKHRKKVRQLFNNDVSQNEMLISAKTDWNSIKPGEFYSENGKVYVVKERPESESKYFEAINKRFRNIFKPIFELLVNKDNEHRETHKQLFASYMNKNCFEAYLETRWKPQNFPDTGVLVELIELSY